MTDNISVEKIWQDNELMQLKIVCSSPVAIAISQIYVSDSLLDKLIYQIKQLLNGYIEEGIWANEERGDYTTACVDFRFFKKDKLGHILIEVFVELDDGGNYSKHNSCFFVNTEYGVLMDFCKKIEQLKKSEIGFKFQLNNF